MSRLYDTIEPSVITEDMLKTAVFEFGPKGEAGNIAKIEGLPFHKAETLHLSYKNILEITNLWWFEKITKLQLDNNIIEQIKGIDHLTNLKWLDLSFNNIVKVEGLETLLLLEDLTLFSNRIERIENLHHLTKLQVLSIGNNKLENMEDIKYLRHLKQMKTLNIKGNPFCAKEEFRVVVLAYLNQLVYLDYRRIKDDERQQSYEREQMFVERLQADDREAEKLLTEQERLRVQEDVYVTAFVDGLDEDQLFDSMFQDDPDGVRLRQLARNEEHAVEFRGKFAENCYALFEYGLEEYKRRQEELTSFSECLNGAKDANKASGIELLAKFLVEKNSILNKLVNNESDDDDELRQRYKDKAKALQSKLMEQEIQLMDQVEEVNKEFERNMEDLVAKFKETINTNLGKCRELDVVYQGKISEEASAIQEKINKGDPTDDISEDLKMILIDKDSMNNALAASKDAHVFKIDGKMDDMIKRIDTWFKNLIDDLHTKEEVERNRSRVMEINLLIDNIFDELHNME